MHLSAKERGRIGGLFLVDGSGGAGVIASRRRLGRRPDRPLTAALAATLTAALATTFVAALLTATLVAADGRGVLLHLATARGRSVLLHLATAGSAAFFCIWPLSLISSPPFDPVTGGLRRMVVPPSTFLPGPSIVPRTVAPP